MKFVFFGTDDYSVAILEKLISDFYYPALVISQPDKPVGRKQVLTPPPIKHVCDTHVLQLLQPKRSIEALEALRDLQPDLFIVASFGQLVPQEILDIPKLGAINVHTSLLPQYRGASPIQAAILNGETRTGVSIMLMDSELDHGPILHQESIEVSDTETNTGLRARLATLGADTLCKVLPDFVSGKIKPVPQDHAQASFTKLIAKEDAKISWQSSAVQIDRMIRAYQDWPYAWTLLPNGKRMKIIAAQSVQTETAPVTAPGAIAISKDSFSISCPDGFIRPTLMQVEGKNEITAAEFSRGYQNLEGKICS